MPQLSPHQLDETELKSIIQNEMMLALGADGGKLSVDRRKLLEQYEGLPYGDEIEGRSQVVDRSILTTVEWILPALLRIFTASDKIVEFEPYRPGEENAANQATQYINYILTRDNNGFILLFEAFKTALIQKVGFLKVAYVEAKVPNINTYTGLNDLEFSELTKPDDVEVLEHQEYQNPDPNLNWFTEDSPEPLVPTLHDCKLRVWQTEGRVKITHVVPEEMLVSRRAPSTLLDGKHFICHRALKTVTELREMGFDDEQIKKAQFYDELEWNSERIARYQLEEDWPLIGGAEGVIDPSVRPILVEESYLPLDWDGDGIAELRKITSAGLGQIIFSNEIIDDLPFIAFCPVPMPGKFYGLGIADLVQDIQEIKTALMRQTLDNLYLTNSPRVIVDEMAVGESTYDDLLTVRPGGIIRVNNVQGIQPLETPFVAQASMPIFEWLAQEQEIRTGISRRNQGLSPDDLNKTATGISLIQQAASQRVELIARIFAEGVKILGQKVLGLVIRHQQEARIIRLTGNWVPVDPRDWRSNMDVICNVGLGTGNRDAAVMHLTQLLQIQQQIVQFQKGVSGPLVTAQDIYTVLEKITENLGFKTSFFSDPSQMPPQAMGQQQQQSPEMMKAQADVQANNVRVQADLQSQQAKAQFEMQLQSARFQHDTQLEQQKAQHAMELEQTREQAKAAMEVARLQAASDRSDPRSVFDRARQVSPGEAASAAPRRAADGNHYVADPNRPGRYMMVV